MFWRPGLKRNLSKVLSQGLAVVPALLKGTAGETGGIFGCYGQVPLGYEALVGSAVRDG